MDNQKPAKTYETASKASEIMKSAVLKFSLFLGENPEKLMPSAPKLVFDLTSKELYIKYENNNNTMTIAGKDTGEQFLRMVINGVVSAHYYQEKQKHRTSSDNDFPANYTTDQLLKISFSSLFTATASDTDNSTALLASNIFRRQELVDIPNLKEMLILLYKNIVGGSLEKFISGIYIEEDYESIDLVGRVLAVAIVIADGGDVKRSLKDMYYKGYKSINSIASIGFERFKQHVDTLFSNNAG
ncbi:hypothetical protein Micr_00125 [Candidatus Micrarchaeum sp.]|uniref:hypothetical protein n=1 Tax=Candidatus Micrarchaeum sp. TaxID=2282148 RepID=UPI00092B015D|nr:hypothetical protein [Candidatus Micrarchaeum sp.]OJI07908.1 MAG: hypothetical protein BK997_01810 [Candidatus Micrarchaeum sp. ARMAN-1]OJT94397.1 MAG: hypothetical protein JJ59_02925 [Candidatus Micrarchaeum sp. AZ1]OWP54023.1 MAG: hypothetical protein B2I19_00750 [Thermoplasmatales archaeon ARMAN]QRF73610.1 hypothetical protein Micr_00125 [Candidatus Micrarchaeum sp.]